MRTALIVVGALVALAAVAVGAVLWVTRSPEPSAFYDPPAELPAEPGTLIRSEPYAAGVPDGAEGWRILYTSTGRDGAPVAVSGVVIGPADPPPGARPVLAYAHGTTGVARGCAPSLTDDPLFEMPALRSAPARGWVVVATDYPGLGTPGPHPYLDGVSEGRAVLDAVRAAGRIDGGPELSSRVVITGVSQGGHATLFAAQLAPAYAPELEVMGAAPAEPATDLATLLGRASGEGGKVLTAEAVYAWSRLYPELSFDEAVRPRARRLARAVARRCLVGPERFVTALGAAVLPQWLLAIDVTRDPRWAARLAQNTPRGPIAAPLLVTQGGRDAIVLPDVSRAEVRARCRRGERVEYREDPEANHLTLPARAGDEIVAWAAARFAGRPVPAACVGLPPGAGG